MISGNEGQSYVYREDVNTSASRKSKIMDPVLGEDEKKELHQNLSCRRFSEKCFTWKSKQREEWRDR